MTTIYRHFPHANGETVTLSLNGGAAQTIAEYNMVADTTEITALGGRGQIIPQQVSNLSEGRAVPLDDGRTYLDFTQVLDAQTVTGDGPDGTVATIYVQKSQQARGHPAGEHYYLPIVDGKFVCEPGQRHRKMYVSRSPSALTKAQVATHAGVAEGAVTGSWLVARPQYGGTPQMAVSLEVFLLYFNEVFSWNSREGRSDHYFFERGYTYTTPGISWIFAAGESEIHPLLVSSFGTGERPGLSWGDNFVKPSYSVLQEVRLIDWQNMWYAFASAVDGCTIRNTWDAQWTSMVTVRNSYVEHPWKDAPEKTTTFNGKLAWLANGNHMGGMYSSGADNILVEGYTVHHAGWGDGYAYDGDATKPMPAFKYSHSLYFSGEVFDITIRHSLLSQPASDAFQMRSGLHVEGNLIVDANLTASWNSSNGKAQYVNAMDNVAFSAGYKRVAYEEGAYNWGYNVNGPLSSMKGNVLAHHANPDDEAEKAAKPSAEHTSYESSQVAKLVNDTQVWKWGATSNNRNVEGLDATTLDQTTIQRYAGSKIGGTFKTIPEFAAWAMAQPSQITVVKEAVDWTKARFGRPRSTRTTPANLSFTPDPDFEGFRWDNRYNWSTKDLPGRNVADTVTLKGHYSKFGNMNADIATLTTGGGPMDVVSGRLSVGTLMDNAEVRIRKAGQLYIGSSDHALEIEATGGRLNLLGDTASLNLAALGHAQVLLGPDCTVEEGSQIHVGGTSLVGWTGTGTALLTMAGPLNYSSFQKVNVSDLSEGMHTIRYAWQHIGKEVTGSISGAKAKVAMVNKSGPRGEILVWLTDLVGVFAVDDILTFTPRRDTDGALKVQTGRITELKGFGIMPLQRFRTNADNPAPTVTATVDLSGGVTINKTGLASGTYDLTGPGVTVTNNGATLPAGVSVTGGKLVLVV